MRDVRRREGLQRRENKKPVCYTGGGKDSNVEKEARQENEVRGGKRNWKQGRKETEAAEMWMKCEG